MPNRIHATLLVVISVTSFCVSCKVAQPHLVFKNRSDRSLHIFINADWPDSSVTRVQTHTAIAPHTADTIPVYAWPVNPPLKGMTLFVFDADFVRHTGGENPQAPFEFLVEDSALARYRYTARELKSMKMTLSFPGP